MIVDILATIQEAYDEGVADMRRAATDWHRVRAASHSALILRARADGALGTATTAHAAHVHHTNAAQAISAMDVGREKRT